MMKLSVPVLHAIRAKLQPRSPPGKVIRAAHPLINRPVSKVNAIVIKASARHPSLQAGDDHTLGTRVADNFSQLYLRSDVVSALESIRVSQPTVIQMLAIPKIAAGRNVLCASETGSGKTLAYLAPLINRLREEEETHGVIPRLRRPRALILLPSRDLAAQVLSVAKSLCHIARFRAVGLVGGIKRRFIKESLKHPVDVAVATPDSLLKFRREEQILLTDLSHVVVDEADTLFDPSFEEATTSILNSLPIRSKKKVPQLSGSDRETQVTIVGATLSTNMLTKIEKLVPNIKKVSTKHLHQILPHVEQRFIKIRQDAKADKLLYLIQSRQYDVFIVFCNTVPSCDWTARFLTKNDVPVIKLHAGFSSQDRKDRLKQFMAEESRVLVCTDIASRGIDCSHVNHVVSFDFPLSLPDYLHRVGRTGRVGTVASKCRATTFMTHRRDVTLAWKVKDAADKREALMNRKVMKKLEKLELSSGSVTT